MASNGPESIDHQTRQLQAIDATMEFAKHQITFAAILVGLSITLNKDLIPVEEEQSLNVLSWSWYVLLVSILSGFVTLGAIVNHLGSDDTERLDPYTRRIRFPLVLQFLLLIIGIVLLIKAVWPHMGG